MGCGNSKNIPEDSNIVQENFIEEEIDYKPIHSAIRWNKIPFDEIKALLKNSKAVDVEDPNNGNTPIHIAVQNGHYNILLYLIERKANVNAQNKRGNTALHMAMAYDYFDCVQALLKAGADKDVVNDLNHPAIKGLEGDKVLGIVALLNIKSSEDAINALNICELRPAELEKASFVGAALKGKKLLGPSWTNEIQDKFKAILANLP